MFRIIHRRRYEKLFQPDSASGLTTIQSKLRPLISADILFNCAVNCIIIYTNGTSNFLAPIILTKKDSMMHLTWHLGRQLRDILRTNRLLNSYLYYYLSIVACVPKPPTNSRALNMQITTDAQSNSNTLWNPNVNALLVVR